MAIEGRDVDVIVGSRIGTLKRVTYAAKARVEILNRPGDLQKGQGISCMTWCDDTETKLLLARDDRTVLTYDLNDARFETLVGVEFGEGKPIGAAVTVDDLIVGASASGTVNTWDADRRTKRSSLSVGATLDAFKLHALPEVAVGGNENDLSVWNIEKQMRVFHAKNVPHDELQLRVPVWVSDVCHLPDADGKLIATCSRYGYVRLYDTRAQRRPVCALEFEKRAGSCIANGHREKHVIVGTGRGLLNLVDLRKRGKLDKSYKGAVGAITQVVCSNNLVISTSLDRHLRIHDAETKKMIFKEYLTTKLTSFVVKKSTVVKIEKEEQEEIVEGAGEIPNVEEEVSSDSEYEDMFKNMEVIGEKNYKKKEAPQIITESSDIPKSKEKKKRKNKMNDEEKVSPKKQKIIANEESAPNETSATSDFNLDENIRKLLKSTEKQKRRLEKQKKEKRSKSLFYSIK